jgi:hypothetical protein
MANPVIIQAKITVLDSTVSVLQAKLDATQERIMRNTNLVNKYQARLTKLADKRSKLAAKL